MWVKPEEVLLANALWYDSVVMAVCWCFSRKLCRSFFYSCSLCVFTELCVVNFFKLMYGLLGLVNVLLGHLSTCHKIVEHLLTIKILYS